MTATVSNVDSTNPQEWVSLLRDVDAEVAMRLVLIQAAPHWVDADKFALRQSIDLEFASVVLSHNAQIEVVRLIGGVEGASRHDWIRSIASWALLRPSAVENYQLYTPNSSHGDRLVILPFEEHEMFENLRREIISHTQGNQLDINESAATISSAERYPIVGSI